MQRIPIQPVSNQTLAVTLARQNVQLALRQMDGDLYITVTRGTESIVRTRICRDRQRLLQNMKYRGFVGELVFVDLHGSDDPVWPGLGSRYQLFYLEAGE